MNEEKPVETKAAEDLTKTKKPGDVRLTEEELSKTSGGAIDTSLKLKIQ